MKRLISTFIAASMMLSSAAFAVEKDDIEIDISAYTNNEIFVMYKNGTSEVITCQNESELSNKLAKLENSSNILLYQPNYSYQTTGSITSDSLITKQWALDNDGTFYMQEQKNEFPVFDKPFSDAKMPGQWQKPDNFGTPGGNFRKRSFYGNTQTVEAVSGIDINIDEAWDLYSSQREVIIAAVDTGIDYTHEDLSGSIWTNTDEIANNGIDDDGNGYVDDIYGWNFYNNSNKIYTGSEDDHGTHGAGTIIATADNETGIAGIIQSDDVKLMSVKALGGSDGSGTTASIIQAIQYAEANGASICNLSLGTTVNDEALYQTMKNSNMLFVVAAGNDSQNIDRQKSYPASYDLENIITVANLTYDGTLDYSSNYGEASVDLAAPGSYILSTTTDNGYSYMTGTSMSAPFVSAACGMVYSHFDDISLAGVKEIILNSVTELESLDGITFTGGMLNLGAALGTNTDTLTYEEWEEKTPYVYTGNAPQIAAQIVSDRNKSYLAVQFYDEDNDLEIAAYAEGQLDTDDFDNGNSGNIIELSRTGVATFEGSIGTFTFYALDSKGNETVKVVEISDERRSNRQYNQSPIPMPQQMPFQNPYQSPINDNRMPNQHLENRGLDIWFNRGGFR